jgi:hypothetical protein
MFLSNPAKSFLASALILTVCGGCGFFKSYTGNAPQAAPEAKSDVPFSLKEPAVFQAEFVSTAGDRSTVSFYAKTDKMYSVSHANKTYAEAPTNQGNTTEPDFINDLTYGLLTETNNAKFEEAGRNGNIVKYKVSIGENAVSQAIIYFDESVGMIVREEFMSSREQPEAFPQPEFIFELRNLEMDVDDSVFAMPAGYRKVPWSDHSTPPKQKK